jgi:hypothetical protein
MFASSPIGKTEAEANAVFNKAVGDPPVAESHSTRFNIVGKRFITNETVVEATGVELSSVLTAGKLLNHRNCHNG